MNNIQRLTVIVCLLVFAAAGALVAHMLTDRSAQTPDTDAVILDEPRLIPDLFLLDHHGTIWSPERLKGQWSLVFFGFTHCPDICPETMIKMNQIYRSVEEKGRALPPSVIFVSVDPARDTPDRLADYVPYFNRHFLGLTGDESSVTRLARAMGVPVSIPEVEPGDDYEVDHGASISLVGPDGHIHAFFTPPHNSESMARDFEAIIKYLDIG